MSVLASPPSTAQRSPLRPRVGHTRPLPPPSNGHAPSYPERDTRSRFWWGQRSRGGLPSRWGKRGQGVRTERKGSDTRIERDEETPLVQRRRAALLRECILVKCTVSTYGITKTAGAETSTVYRWRIYTPLVPLRLHRFDRFKVKIERNYPSVRCFFS